MRRRQIYAFLQDVHDAVDILQAAGIEPDEHGNIELPAYAWEAAEEEVAKQLDNVCSRCGREKHRGRCKK